MSKTKGNVIDPIDIIERFGTDAVRFTLASHGLARHRHRLLRSPHRRLPRLRQQNLERRPLPLHEHRPRPRSRLQSHHRLTSAPHLSLETLDLPEHTPLETRWIFARLHAVSAEVDRALTDYRFDEAANAIYQFFWGELCDWYLELVKLRLDFPETTHQIHHNDTTALTLAALTGVFEAALRLLSPLHALPHRRDLARPLRRRSRPQNPSPSPATRRPPTSPPTPSPPRNGRPCRTSSSPSAPCAKNSASPKRNPPPSALHASNRVIALADANQDMLARMARVSSIEFAADPLSGTNARSTADFDVAVIYERQIDIPAERERLTKDLAKYEKGLAAAESSSATKPSWPKPPPTSSKACANNTPKPSILYDKTKAALDALN